LDEQAVTYHCLPCPTSSDDFTFHNQAEIDDFGAMYVHCSDIVLGNVTISGNDITNLDGLSNVTDIGGNLTISNNSGLTNLDGLSNVTNIEGNLTISNNSQLTNLNELSSVTEIGGNLVISNNSGLTDISGFTNIDPATITGLVITDNSELSVCNLTNFCTYLSNPANPRTISGNAGYCLDEQAVTYHCLPCPTEEDDFTFSNQAAINDFVAMYAHCTDITVGSITISGNDITNLDGLSKITNITGFLRITENTALTNLDGFENLETIGGYLYIDQNGALTNIDGLENLQTIGGFVSIYLNPNLISLNGLQSLTSVGADFHIDSNAVLANLDGLSNLTQIGGQLYINGNAALTDISGLTNIDPETIGGTWGLYIVDNLLLSVCNLPNFCTYLSNPAETHPRTISGNAGFCLDEQAVTYHCLPCPTEEDDFTFSTQQQIDDFGAMYAHCTGIVLNNVTISGADITNLDGLSNITNIGGRIVIASNPQLTHLDGLSNVTDIGENLYIQNNTLLTNLDGLSNLTEIGGYLNIYNNSGLTNIDGLNNVTEIGGYLAIFNNSGLTNLDGLSNVTDIGGDLYIQANTVLTDISGLANIDPATIPGFSGLYIVDNPALSVCNLPNFCTYLSDETHPSTISGNAGNCLDEQAVIASCVPCPTGDYFFDSQAEIDDFGAMYALCTDITLGDVSISGSGISNLNGLSNLKNVTGEFRLYNINTLINTDGLSNLTTVGDWLQISSISSTSVAMNLSGLTSVGGDFQITGNSALTAIDLSSLTSVGDELRITNNSALTAVNLNSLTNSPVYISIGQNNVLTNLNLDNLTTVGGLSISINSALPNLNTLSNLTTVGSSGLSINTNDALTDINGLSNLTTIEGGLGIYSIPSLTHLDALSNLTTLGGMLEIGLPQLTNLDGLSGLTSTGGINLSVNPSLTDIDGLSNITTLGGNLRINDVDALTNLDGLNGLTSIGGRIEITRNALLTNLDGLSNVTSVQGEIRIGGFTASIGNPQLTDISGLQNISAEGITNLYIRHNPLLSVCNLPNFCTYLSDENNTRTIQNNAGNCISIQAVTDACAGNCDGYTVWNGTEWSGGEPDSAKKAIIDGSLALSSDMESCELELSQNGQLEIPSGKTFTVNGAIVNNAGEENFIVESDGNLIQVEDVENTGAITVRRNSTPMMRLDYALWSSPVDGQGIHAFSPETVASRIYTYEGESGYQLVPDLESSDFIAGKGYMFRAPNNWNLTTDANDGNPVAYPGEFKGVPFNGDISIAVHAGSYTSVGNPYPSNIKLGDNPSNPENDTFLNANPEVGTVYFWTNTYGADGAGGYTGNNWATYTLAGGTSAGFGSGGTTPVPFVAPGQGFIISSTESGTSVSFNNTMRTSEEAIFFKNEEEETARFWLNLDGTNDESYNQILVGYMNGATLGIDNQIDGKMFGYEGSAIYNLIDDASTGSATRFTIQGRPLPFEADDVVPLGFRAIESGKFKISLSNYEGIFSEGQITIFIKDKALHIIHNLMESDYEFESVQGEFNDRFEVVYEDDGTMGTDDQSANAIRIYTDKDYIVVDSKTEKILSVELFDLSGRNLFRNEKVNAHHYRVKSASKGIIVVKARAENGEIVTKKVINK